MIFAEVHSILQGQHSTEFLLSVVKSLNKVYFFVNGNLKSTQDNIQSYSVIGDECDVGCQGPVYYFSGYID